MGKSRGSEVQVAGGGGDRFVPDDRAKVGVGCLFVFTVADAAIKQIRTIADVALVLIRPFHEARVAVCGFHVGKLVFRLGFGNNFGDLAFLVGFGVVALGSVMQTFSLR